MKFTKLIRNKKAISPIFATLILIAIAVIAGIVVYMFTSGTIATMTGGGTAGQEKVAIQSVQYDNTAAAEGLVIWAKSTGGGEVIVDGAILKDSGGNTVEVLTDDVSGGPLDAAGTLTQIDVDLSGLAAQPADGTYTVTLTSTNGGSFVSSSFKIIAP